MNKQFKTIQFNNYECTIRTRKYGNGRPAIELLDAEDNMPVAVASVNIPEAPQEPGDIFIKSWSENEGMAAVLMNEGIIGPIKGKVPTGFVSATVHKLLI